MALSDQELMLLEQLEYLNSAVEKKAGIKISDAQKNSVAGIVNAFDEEALKELQKNKDDYPSGEEFAAIIRQIKQTPGLMDLTRQSRSDSVFATCYTDSSGNAYVSFQGTATGNEWFDDAEGLLGPDTQCQKEALDYIESLPYDNITVTGHSKGGNKAQYVTITSDKVTRCVSMDGQGFSPEFMEKYRAEIIASGEKIKNYSLSTDYVHILLYPVPGAEQIYCQGDESLAGTRNHSPSAFYQFFTDNDGNNRIVMDKDGQTALVKTSENEAMVYLHQFTCFILELMPDDKKQQTIEYVGNILALGRTDDFVVPVNGVTYTHADVMAYVFSDPDTAALAIAYFIKFVKTYNLSNDQINALIEAFGLQDMIRKIQEAIADNPKNAAIAVLAADFIDILMEEIEDGENDAVVNVILEAIYDKCLKDFLKKHFGDGASLDMVKFWKTIEAEYQAIGEINKTTAIRDQTVSKGKIINYSRNTYDTIKNTMDAVEKATFDVSSEWSNYSGYSWYSSLGITHFSRGINNYFEFLAEINQDCAKQVEKKFETVGTIDSSKADRLAGITAVIDRRMVQMEAIADRLS